MDLNYVTINNDLMKGVKVMNEKKKRKVIPWDKIKEKFQKGKSNDKDKS